MPAEIISDQGMNSRGAESELQEAFAAMSPDLLAKACKTDGIIPRQPSWSPTLRWMLGKGSPFSENSLYQFRGCLCQGFVSLS